MGQQQLLLVILVTIIVGIATVVALNVFGTAFEQSNIDAVRQDIMSAAVQAQAIWVKPAMMDGAGRNFQDQNIISQSDILKRLIIPGELDNEDNPTQVTNENGVYSLSVTGSSQLVITGQPSNAEDPVVAVVCQDTDRNWLVNIDNEGATDTSGCSS